MLTLRSSIYGQCSRCDMNLEPVWYTEREEELVGGVWIKTGRKRKSCSHLLCPCCGNTECVDDSFDGPWY
jgi:hypothetical protein